MHEVEVRDSPIQGRGVFATAGIPSGDLIRRYNLVREVTEADPIDPARGESIEHCTYPDGRVFLVGAPDRHFNHSCDPNAWKRFRASSIELVARRPIAAGEEITHDYLINTHGGSSWACRCGAARCRRTMPPSFFDLPRELQLEYVPYLADWFEARHRLRVHALRAEASGAPDGASASEGESLPDAFLAGVARLGPRYLESPDPRRQSGFGGGAERWRAEREPILDPIDRDGSLLDLGCANGFLAECLRDWASERGVALTPYGLDLCPELIEVARRRMPQFADHFVVGNAWSWSPPRRFTWVYTLADVVPQTHLGSYLSRLREHFLEPEGRLIVGSYGSRSRGLPPLDLEALLPSYGLPVAGTAGAGEDDLVRFAWTDAEDPSE